MALPEYLLATDQSGDTEYLVRTIEPRFIAEIHEPNGELLLVPNWIDDPNDFSDDFIRDLMRAASEWYKEASAEDAALN